MKVRIHKRNYKLYAMDIESHNDSESRAKRETSMWLGCFIDENSKVDDESSYFYDMDEFLDRCEEITTPKRHNSKESRQCKNIAVYIYNLSFEWSFLLPVMLTRGFEFSEGIDDESEFKFNSISTKSVSSVWEVKFKFHKKSGYVILRDLAKLYGGGLANVAKAFNLPTQKGEIDYLKNRLHRKKRYATKKEKIYCFKDTRIIIDILLSEVERGDKDFFNAVSMASYSMLKLLKTAFPKALKPYREYRKYYPELEKEENEFVRHALAGGICYACSNYQFKDIKAPILHIDLHQAHPSQVALKPHPYGYGEYFKGKPTKYFKHINVCHIRVSYDAVKLHSIIKLIGLSTAEMFELYVFDFEIPLMYECYVNLEIDYIDGYCYKARFVPWKQYVVNNFIERKKAKAVHDAYNTLRYKLLNNAGAYGKFVEKPHTEVFQNYINEDGIIDSMITEKTYDNELKEYNAKYTYIPLASIPAWTRVQLVSTALKFGWKNVCYFDTDSIFCIYNEETKKVLESEINLNDELGGWGIEEICTRAQFTAPKRYKTETEGKAVIKAGGINFDAFKEHTHSEEVEYYMSMGMSKREALSKVDIPYDEVNIVTSEWQVQRAYRVKGGTIIEFQTKTMDVQKKYIDIYKANT